MKITAFSKLILSSILVLAMTAAVAGCGSPEGSTSSGENTDDSSAVSVVESSDGESSAEKEPVEISIVSSDKDESKAYKPESKSEATESQPEKSEEETTEPESSIEESSEQAEKPVSKTEASAPQEKNDNKEASGNIVVMLDPGHDSGCSPRDNDELGVSEQTLNLKIGLACYERLSQYEGITPYLTRYDNGCPNADKMFDDGGNFDCIQKRAYLADNKDADIFISLHCNAATNDGFQESVSGIMVIVSNYPKYTDESTRLGNMIIDHVTNAVDLDARGVELNATDEEQGYYDDGTPKDKLHLLNYNIEYGRPAIVVEHAFMDNPHDNAILKDDEKLQLIGRADADAIAEYYGLKLRQ